MDTVPVVQLTNKQMLFHIVAKGMFAITVSFLAQEGAGRVYDKVVMNRYIVHDAPTAA